MPADEAHGFTEICFPAKKEIYAEQDSINSYSPSTSVASCQRRCSEMNLMKNTLRLVLHSNSLTGLLMIKINDPPFELCHLQCMIDH
jgi:hypothetical protein